MTSEPPHTYAEAVDRLIADMSPEDSNALRDLPEEELLGQHFGPALYVPNTYGLWKGNAKFMEACAEQA